MSLRSKWTPEEDRRLLSFVDDNKAVDCNEVARLMNAQNPIPPPGLYVKIYYPDDVHTRLYQLLQPRYRYLTPPLEVTGAAFFNLGLKHKQHNLAPSGSSSVQLSSIKTKPEENLKGKGEEYVNQEAEERSAELERYGQPELYAELFPSLSEELEAHQDHEVHKENKHHDEHGQLREKEMVGEDK